MKNKEATMKYSIIVILSILFLSGCSIKEVQIKPSHYTLDPIVKLERFATSNNDVIKVARIDGPSGLNTRAILYKKEGTLQPYKYGNWSETPSLKLQHLITEALQDQHHFHAVVLGNSMATNNLTLEPLLQNFEEVFEGDTSFVHVSLRFRLVDVRSGEVLASIKLISKKPVTNTNGAAGTVEAFDLATAEIIKNLSIWINEARR